MKIINGCILFFFVWGAASLKADTDSTPPVFPQQLTAQTLLVYCASSSLTAVGRNRQRYCWGFISGVEETLRLRLNASGQPAPPTICVPEDVSSRTLAQGYIQYAGRRGINLAPPAAQMVIKALVNTYPCLDERDG